MYYTKKSLTFTNVFFCIEGGVSHPDNKDWTVAVWPQQETLPPCQVRFKPETSDARATQWDAGVL